LRSHPRRAQAQAQSAGPVHLRQMWMQLTL
jgi:hypothetical protein